MIEAVAVELGPVSAYLRDLIIRQLEDENRRPLVWFDPTGDYRELVERLDIPDASLVRYKGSFFALRYAADRFLETDRPRLVVYVPLTEEETHHALIELTAPGTILKPGAPGNRNTRLAVIARAALQNTFTESELAKILEQVKDAKLRLADLDRLSSGGPDVLSLIFETNDRQEIVLRFLTDDSYDAVLSDRSAVHDLAETLSPAFGVALPSDEDCRALRARLSRHVLTGEFLASLDSEPPTQLASLAEIPPAPRQACVSLVRSWRSRRELRESYAERSARVEADLGIPGIQFDFEQIRDAQTFLSLEGKLQAAVEIWLATTPSITAANRDQYRALIADRLDDFWSSWPDRFPQVQPRWELSRTILNLLEAAERLEINLKGAGSDPGHLLDLYTLGTESDPPWCLLDTYHRHLEQQYHAFADFDYAGEHNMLDRAINRARQRYTAVAGDLAERFVHALADARFQLPKVMRQTQVYAKRVKPATEEGKTAYILVDALRFEMAREQFERLQAEYRGELSFALATVPTLTPIGMGSLMPGAEDHVSVVPAGVGNVGLRLDEVVLTDRKSRLEWFATQQPDGFVHATLEDMLPKPDKGLEARLRGAHLVLVTSQEIDKLAEGDNVRQARLLMDYILVDLARLVNKLRDYGCKTIIVTSDHGYLFGEEIDEDMKIDPPGGKTADLHRRAWIGNGGAASDAYLRVPLSTLGQGSDLDLAVPWGFGVFKVQGGARAYFHGGMAPQEMVIPVMVLHSEGAAQQPSQHVSWTLNPGSRQLSTVFFAVTIEGQATDLFGIETPPRVRIEVRAGGQVISKPVSATYGFEEATGDVQLRTEQADPHAIEADTVTVHITQIPAQKAASLHLLDAVTGVELVRLETIPVAMQEY